MSTVHGAAWVDQSYTARSGHHIQAPRVDKCLKDYGKKNKNLKDAR
jgi:hypothetical protein